MAVDCWLVMYGYGRKALGGVPVPAKSFLAIPNVPTQLPRVISGNVTLGMGLGLSPLKCRLAPHRETYSSKLGGELCEIFKF